MTWPTFTMALYQIATKIPGPLSMQHFSLYTGNNIIRSNAPSLDITPIIDLASPGKSLQKNRLTYDRPAQADPVKYGRFSYNTGVTLSDFTSSKFFCDSFPLNGIVGIKFVNYGDRNLKLKINKHNDAADIVNQ